MDSMGIIHVWADNTTTTKKEIRIKLGVVFG